MSSKFFYFLFLDWTCFGKELILALDMYNNNNTLLCFVTITNSQRNDVLQESPKVTSFS